MGTLVRFMLSLFFLFLGGYTSTFASVHHDKISDSIVQHGTKVQQAKIGNLNSDRFIVKNSHLNEKKEDFFSIEDEDEDVVFSGTDLLLHKYFITLSYASTSTYSNNYFNVRLPFCRHLSYTSSFKYILQRVLRL